MKDLTCFHSSPADGRMHGFHDVESWLLADAKETVLVSAFMFSSMIEDYLSK